MSKRNYTPAEEKLIKAIPVVKGRKNQLAALADLSKQLDVKTETLWYKWYNMVARGKTYTRHSTSGKKAFVFREVERIKIRGIIPEEQKLIQQGIDIALKKSFSKGKGIIIPKRFQSEVKKYLEKVRPNLTFSFHNVPRNKNEKMVVQRAV